VQDRQIGEIDFLRSCLYFHLLFIEKIKDDRNYILVEIIGHLFIVIKREMPFFLRGTSLPPNGVGLCPPVWIGKRLPENVGLNGLAGQAQGAAPTGGLV
jgi:hypothetical protein